MIKLKDRGQKVENVPQMDDGFKVHIKSLI
jgi:hypothetical protein